MEIRKKEVKSILTKSPVHNGYTANPYLIKENSTSGGSGMITWKSGVWRTGMNTRMNTSRRSTERSQSLSISEDTRVSKPQKEEEIMRYMGGKFRQSKALCQVLKPFVNEDTVYAEPFCGGMWSAARVARELHPGRMILNDINKPLMLLWEKCLEDGCDWLPTGAEWVEQEYPKYKTVQDDNDPLTAWYGIALSFGGKWFGGLARGYNNNGTRRNYAEESVKSTRHAVDILNCLNVDLHIGSYKDLEIPDDAVVYLDPPYEGRTKAHHFDEFDYGEFWEWVRELSKRCTVFTSCFDCPSDFKTVYEWGDTVVRHLNSKGTDGTNERLVKYNE